MRRPSFLNLLPLLIFLGGCIEPRHEYLLSPNNASTIPYQPIPMVSDSLPAGHYLNFWLGTGSANDQGVDNVSAFSLSYHRSHNLSSFQAFYGGGIRIGSYNMADYLKTKYNDSYGYPFTMPMYDTVVHIPPANDFYGEFDIHGGINVVLPFDKGEWRPIGIEMAAEKEFGQYYQFRKNLPDTMADIIFKNNLTATLGIYTDIMGKTSRGIEFGYKVGYGIQLNSTGDFTKVQQSGFFPLTYLSQTFHLTDHRLTWFIQLNIGIYASSLQTGFSYRIGK